MVVTQGVCQDAQGAKIRLNFVEAFDLAIEVALCGGIEFSQTGTLRRTFKNNVKKSRFSVAMLSLRTFQE